MISSHSKNIYGIILEGIPGSGKTAIFRQLRRHLSESDDPCLFLPESCTERILEPLIKSSVSDSILALKHLLNIVSFFKNLSCKSSDKVIKYFILERFHMSHCLDIAGKDFFHEYNCIEQQLLDFNTIVVLLTMSPDVIEKRSVIQTKKNRPDTWSKYLSTLGSSDTAIAGYYAEQQESFLSLCRQSGLPNFRFDTTKENWAATAASILQMACNS